MFLCKTHQGCLLSCLSCFSFPFRESSSSSWSCWQPVLTRAFVSWALDWTSTSTTRPGSRGCACRWGRGAGGAPTCEGHLHRLGPAGHGQQWHCTHTVPWVSPLLQATCSQSCDCVTLDSGKQKSRVFYTDVSRITRLYGLIELHPINLCNHPFKNANFIWSFLSFFHCNLYLCQRNHIFCL